MALAHEGVLVEGLDQRRQSVQELFDVLQDCRCGNIRRLHTQQQSGLPVNLPQRTEHRIAQLQLHSQALIERRLADMGEQAPGGFVGQFPGGCGAEQQQRMLAGVGLYGAPQVLRLD
ncbi:hypothetical protein D9M73_285970 [compost metagenome]